MIFYELKDIEGSILVSTIGFCPESIIFINNEEKNLRIGNLKNAFKRTSNGSVRILIKDQKDLLKSSRLVSDKINAYAEVIDVLIKVKEKQDNLYKILFHNLITTHAKLQGEIESIVIEKEMIDSQDYKGKIELVKNNILSDTSKASQSILEIAKGITDFQAQIQGIKMLRGDISLDLGHHSIKRVLLAMMYSFYEEFNRRNILIRLNIDDEISDSNRIKIDYKIFNVAMHHFLNNISKYVKPYSTVDVSFNHIQNFLEFSMCSTKIEKGEILSIYELGVSGKNVGDLAGDGVGMFMVKRSLDLLGCRMEIIPNYSEKISYDGIDYIKNKFKIYFQVLK